MSAGNVKAADDEVWVCGACGKMSIYKYGFDNNSNRRNSDGVRYASAGWDESCMLNSSLVKRSQIRLKDDRVIEILPEE